MTLGSGTDPSVDAGQGHFIGARIRRTHVASAISSRIRRNCTAIAGVPPTEEKGEARSSAQAALVTAGQSVDSSAPISVEIERVELHGSKHGIKGRGPTIARVPSYTTATRYR